MIYHLSIIVTNKQIDYCFFSVVFVQTLLEQKVQFVKNYSFVRTMQKSNTVFRF